MDYRQFRYFIAVAEELSFTRAAKRLNISQPPLSVQIKALEDEVGTSLFARSRRKVNLTPAGELLLENAKKAIGHLEHTTNMVRRAGLGQAGVIRLAFTGSVPMREAFARLLRTFRQTYPDVRFELQHMATGRQFEALAQDQIDIGILRPPASLARERSISPNPDLARAADAVRTGRSSAGGITRAGEDGRFDRSGVRRRGVQPELRHAGSPDHALQRGRVCTAA